LCADGDPSKGVKSMSICGMVHMDLLFKFIHPAVKRCNIVQRFDRLTCCFLAYFENDWTQHLCWLKNST
jgi:hypothetical protein